MKSLINTPAVQCADTSPSKADASAFLVSKVKAISEDISGEISGIQFFTSFMHHRTMHILISFCFFVCGKRRTSRKRIGSFGCVCERGSHGSHAKTTKE